MACARTGPDERIGPEVFREVSRPLAVLEVDRPDSVVGLGISDAGGEISVGLVVM